MLGLIHLREPKIVCTTVLCYVGHLPSCPPSLVNQAKGKLLMMLPALHRISQEITGGALIGQSSYQNMQASKPTRSTPLLLHGRDTEDQKTAWGRNHFKGTKGNDIKAGPIIECVACKCQVVTGPLWIKAGKPEARFSADRQLWL